MIDKYFELICETTEWFICSVEKQKFPDLYLSDLLKTIFEWQLHHYKLILQQPTVELAKPQAGNVARGVADPTIPKLLTYQEKIKSYGKVPFVINIYDTNKLQFVLTEVKQTKKVCFIAMKKLTKMENHCQCLPALK